MTKQTAKRPLILRLNGQTKYRKSIFDGTITTGRLAQMFKDITSSVAKWVPLIMTLWPLSFRYAGEMKGLS